MAYVQSQFSTEGASPKTCVLSGVAAGNTLVAFVLADGSGAPTGASSSLDGAMTAQGSVIGPTNAVSLQIYVKQNCSSGSHTFTGTSANDVQIIVAEFTAPTSGTLNSNKNSQAAPGASADAITTGSITVAASATIVALACDVTNTGAGYQPVAGTGFTVKQGTNNADMGSWSLEVASFSSNHAATFTVGASDGTGANSYISAGIAIPEPSGVPSPSAIRRIYINP